MSHPVTYRHLWRGCVSQVLSPLKRVESFKAVFLGVAVVLTNTTRDSQGFMDIRCHVGDEPGQGTKGTLLELQVLGPEVVSRW